jgi:ornithine cyclodeaminase/alanine dehydrogenase-like protein (mu-crystallin family)
MSPSAVAKAEAMICDELMAIAAKQRRLRGERPARDRAMITLRRAGMSLEDLAYAAGVSQARARHIVGEVAR